MNRITNYLRQSRAELSKVVWPNRATATRYTIAVVAFSAVLAVFIGVMDYIFTQVIQKLIIKV